VPRPRPSDAPKTPSECAPYLHLKPRHTCHDKRHTNRTRVECRVSNQFLMLSCRARHAMAEARESARMQAELNGSLASALDEIDRLYQSLQSVSPFCHSHPKQRCRPSLFLPSLVGVVETSGLTEACVGCSNRAFCWSMGPSPRRTWRRDSTEGARQVHSPHHTPPLDPQPHQRGY
jgi:hypothetical protein